ncbi:MAG TPA: DUF4133 domain-containing protein [Sphingobacteriaceae bacterium]
MAAVYQINKGINKPIEFKGLKAQYIGYLAVGLVALLILFAALYIMGVNLVVCLLIIAALGALLFTQVYRLSHTYGQYGLMKRASRRYIPAVLKIRSRKPFILLSDGKSH